MVKSQKKIQLRQQIAELSKQLAELEGTEPKPEPTAQGEAVKPDMQMKVYRLKNAMASGVLTTIYDLFPEFEEANNQIRVTSEHHTNSIIVVGNNELQKLIGDLITKIDVSTDETEASTETLTPKTVAEITAALERKLSYAEKKHQFAVKQREMGISPVSNEAAARLKMQQAKTSLLKWKYGHSDAVVKTELKKEILESIDLSIKAVQDEHDAFSMSLNVGVGGVVAIDLMNIQDQMEDLAIEKMLFLNPQ